MIQELTGLPDGVIGFEVAGKVDKIDYLSVVIPAVERAAATGQVRFLVVMDGFDGMTGGALAEDLKVAFESWHKWHKVAVVTDISWVHHLTDLFGWMTPGQVRTFPMSDRNEALTWVAA